MTEWAGQEDYEKNQETKIEVPEVNVSKYNERIKALEKLRLEA